MAYNVLKGNVEGSVDQHADQEISGVKVFKRAISASVFYDTDSQSPCATLKEVPIQELKGATKNALITFQGGVSAQTEYNLTFDGKELKTKSIRAETLYGSAKGLHEIPADRFSSMIPAEHLKVGSSLRSVRNELQVKGSKGIVVEKTGLSVALDPNGALGFRNDELCVEPKNCAEITVKGQNLSDDDILMVHDASRGDTRRTTLSNFYSSYINSKTLQPSGPLNSVQLRAQSGFKASKALTFDTTTNVLNLDGQIVTDSLRVTGDTFCEGEFKHRGAVFKNIATINDKQYEVRDTDYTLLVDTTNNSVTMTLPPASECKGRTLIIKKINTCKYKLTSHLLTVQVEEGLIDFKDNFELKFNYSSRTLQSDGGNWWIINKVGS